jgi:hypothetical protein
MGTRDILEIKNVERIAEQVYKIPYKDSRLSITQPFYKMQNPFSKSRYQRRQTHTSATPRRRYP